MNRTSAKQPASSGRPAWVIVAIREIVVKVTDKAFIIGTLTTLGLIIAGFAVSLLVSTRTQTIDVAVTTPEAAALARSVDLLAEQSGAGDRLRVVEVADQTQARAQVESGEASVFLHHEDHGWVTTWQSAADSAFGRQLEEVLETQAISDLAHQAGISDEALAQRLDVSTEVLDPDAAGGPLGMIAAIVFGVLFMISSMTYGMQIATSVIEEKQSRIVEILVAVIPVRQLLAGKVVGNTVIAFAQLVIMLAAGMIGLSLTALSGYLPGFAAAAGWFLLFFLAGFLALACIWAATGALGTRSEDLNQTSTPLMWVLMATYFAAFAATGTVRTALSFVPIVSAVLMPARLVEGSVSWWEPLAALASNLAFAVLMVLLGERIYRRALLRTAGRLKWRQAITLHE